MKNKLLFSAALVAALFAATFYGCQNEDLGDQMDLKEQNSFVLEQETPLYDFLLPPGTKVTQISASQVHFELPEEYVFLRYDPNEGVEFGREESYACTCSGDNPCTVFHHPDLGFGCLQGDCSGTCTGKRGGGPNTKQVLGVLNASSEHLIGERKEFLNPGSLSKQGYDIFFEQVVKEELMELVEFAYSGSAYKNSSDLIAKEGEQSVTYVKLQYMGISFAIAVPNFDEVKDKQFINFEAGSRVSCTGSNGCTCKLEKTCILGNCIHYCNECTTSTLVVEE
ncbi:MAG: hypothetical protein D6730_22375 [Bacteroidetes bacterium]|nr:MAG: hypothetical protein D6730_22375 [Bacteroidota bacterium]